MNLKIFHPTIQLTTNIQMLSTTPAKRFFPHITVPSVVQVIKMHKTVAEVQFPTLKETDIVSVDYLHCVDSPEVSYITRLLKKEQERERSN